MAKDERLRYFIEALWKGKGATAAASRDIKDVGKSAETSSMSLSKIAGVAAGVGVALASVGVAASQAYGFLKEGAELSRTADQFDRLTASIGSTSDAMLNSLKAATQGLVSDSELMAGASQIISLGLADTEEGVVRLANLVSQLGWDMQQVILTFANNSTMRLDSLGLSVEDVTKRMKELEASGMSADAAFDLAVIEAGEEKLKLLGSAALTSSGQFQIMEAQFRTSLDKMKLAVADFVLEPERFGFQQQMDALVEQGLVSVQQMRDALAQAGEEITIGDILGDDFTVADRYGLALEILKELAATNADFVNGLSAGDDRLESMAESGADLGFSFRQMTDSAGEFQARLDSLASADAFRAQRQALYDINRGMRDAIATAREFNTEASNQTQQQVGGFFSGLFDIDTLRMQYGEAYQFVIDKTTQIEEVQAKLDDIVGGRDADWEPTRNQAKKIAELTEELAKLEEAQGQIGQGFATDEGMAMAAGIMIESAAAAGTWSKQMFELAGGTEAAGEALKQAAINAKAEDLGEAVAAGAMTAQAALAELQTFADGLTLEDVFDLDKPLAGEAAIQQSVKDRMLPAFEGVATSVETAAEPVNTALGDIKDQLEELDTAEATPEIIDNTAEVEGELLSFQNYWYGSIDGMEATATLHIVTEGMPDLGDLDDRAGGGPVVSGMPYVVGENGPELFIPNMSGMIAPNSSASSTGTPWAGGGSMGAPVTVNQFMNGMSPSAVTARARGAIAKYSWRAR